MTRRPLWPDEMRFLRAASEQRIVENAAGRWTIVGDQTRPPRKLRESMTRRGYVELRHIDGAWHLVPTDTGQALLAGA